MINMSTKVVDDAPIFAELLAREDIFVAIFVARWSAASQPFFKGVAAALLESGSRVVAVDVDAYPHYADQFTVISVPTAIIFKGKAEQRRFIGATNPTEIAEIARATSRSQTL